MKRVRSVFVALALFVMSCNFVGNVVSPEPTSMAPETISYADCPNPQPTQEDIDLALQHSNKYFSSSDWKMSYGVMEQRVSVTWKSDKLGAVSNFDHIILCGATSTALDDYYTAQTFDVIFQYYDSHDSQRECQSNNLRLYEFEVQNQGLDYNARFWVEILDKNHTRESLLVFPIADLENLDSYSKEIMPKLSSCD